MSNESGGFSIIIPCIVGLFCIYTIINDFKKQVKYGKVITIGDRYYTCTQTPQTEQILRMKSEMYKLGGKND